MLKPSRRSSALIVLSGSLACVSVACGNVNPSEHPSELVKPVSTDSVPLPAVLPASPVGTDVLPICRDVACNLSTTKTASDAYEQALDIAESAITISQSAQSVEDWHLIVSRWQEAIALLKAVPVSSPKKAIAKRKISEFQRNLAYAQTQATQPDPSPRPSITVLTIPTPPKQQPRKVVKPLPPFPGEPSDAPAQITTQTSASPSPNIVTQRVFRVPIKRRQGGVPVVNVLFNGTQTFEMIVDTGASATLITQQMSVALSLVPQGKALARTASGAVVEFPLGNIKSIEVGGTVAKDLVVAIGGPEVEIGLLGHDFFGNYDVTIKQDVVEFRER